MNRRNFIKSIAVASVGLPAIAKAITKPEPFSVLPYRPWGNDFVTIMSVDELQKEGIRSAIYSANCVDWNGAFAHEDGYIHEHSEPFVRKTHVIQTLPQYWVGKYWYNEATGKVKERVQEHVQKLRLGKMVDGVKYSLDESIAEIKKHMKYVCLFEYMYFPEVPEEGWPAKWMPIIGGLEKRRYKRHMASLNNYMTDEEYKEYVSKNIDSEKQYFCFECTKCGDTHYSDGMWSYRLRRRCYRCWPDRPGVKVYGINRPDYDY